mgnify:FL=1
MNEFKQFFKRKSLENLKDQVSGLESFYETKIGPESIRESIISSDLEKLKNSFPRAYQDYLFFLRDEAFLKNFPDINKNNKGIFEKSKITFLPTATRGNSFKISFSESVRVIKPLESPAEKNIAVLASGLSIGPKQHKSKKGYLQEEFINGTPLLNLEDVKCTPEFMESLGKKFMKALRYLHEKNILVNDQILTDDFGKSHMIIDINENVRFIDFGASINIESFPDISNDEVFSLMRTDPYMMFQIDDILSADEEEKNKKIRGYRDHVLSQYKTKEDIIRWKDMQLLNEGFMFLQHRLPNVHSFIKGIKTELL